MVYVALKRHYPDFKEFLDSIPDHHQRRSYEVAELIMAGLSMFLFKRGSRNRADLCVNATFEKNYAVVFGMRIPVPIAIGMDTVDCFLRKLEREELEKLKATLVKQLIEKKVLEKWKYGGHYLVSVDGTGLCSPDSYRDNYEPYEGCPYKISKNGNKTWQAYAIEAKLLGANGFSISMMSCWLENSENMDEKQDC